MIAAWKQRARTCRDEVYALALAYHDPRVSWKARLWLVLVVGYALSPVDLIPDPIPVLGALDDLVLIPLGVLLAQRLIPPAVLADCRAQVHAGTPRPAIAWVVGILVAGLWAVLLGALVYRLVELIR